VNNLLKNIPRLIKVIPKLGYFNVAYMFWYRISMNLGIRKGKFPLGDAVKGGFFESTPLVSDYPEEWKLNAIQRANNILQGQLTWFHYHKFQVGNPPNWFKNPFDGSVLNNPTKHWTEISDFDLNTGDVKILWEPSRFDWLTDLARAYLTTGEEKYLETINHWLRDWSLNNPKNQGPNWKCGQETSIRLMKLISVATILKFGLPLQKMVFEHLTRIRGNIRYAIAQNNNHGTSEAAALYIGSAWLLKQSNCSFNKTVLTQWKKQGRRILEDRISRLIAKDGTFSQRSINYHRVVTDTLSWVLFNIEQLNEKPFSEPLLKRLESLGYWQLKMMSSDLGEVPNLGSNDGAMFETFHSCDYRDFRPSTQLFFGVLKKQKVFKEEKHDEPLFWRYPQQWQKLPVIEIKVPEIEILDGQFLIINHQDIKLFLKIPINNFRPSGNDAFHVDLWYQQKNILCDSGSYSYNAGDITKWFKSVEAHNTIQFGKRQQMPNIGRFLFANWVQGKTIRAESNNGYILWEGSYRDGWGAVHMRKLEYDKNEGKITLTDTFIKKNQEDVTMYMNSNHDLLSMIRVQDKDGTLINPMLNKTYLSLYYMQKTRKTTYAYKAAGNQIITTIDLSK